MTEPLWRPSPEAVDHSQMAAFGRRLGFGDYDALYDFSVSDKAAFWSALWEFCDVIGHPGGTVLRGEDAMPGAEWFPDGTLNFAENLLRDPGDEPALVTRRENGAREVVSRRELLERATAFGSWLRVMGIQPGDRVAAFMPNIAETVIAMLGASSVGAVFSSCSPDFGIQGVLDRFGQIAPRILVCADGYEYNGRYIDSRPRLEAIVSSVPSIERVVLVHMGASRDLPELGVGITHFEDMPAVDGFKFEQLPFNHPLYIMYSSGTTGTPKCIVHGAGGTLLQHLKEHRLHTDLSPRDVLFYFTTCGWMMWNWLISGLASGAALVLYDGSPFFPGPRAMLDLIDSEGITVFGTSAKYIASIEKVRVRPRQTHNLTSLRMILSTGSPLTHESFRYVYREVKEDVCLASISGGTDIVSCFALGNPMLPVFEGELQCRGLGMDVHILGDDGERLVGRKGELVCASPFPSMPVGFWNDPGGERYSDAYFSRFPGFWAHGDYGELTAGGGVIIYGRSDAVLNPGGVRIGTAEIYRQVEKVDDVVDAICVGQSWKGDVRVILFVVLREGASLDDELIDEIKSTIRENTTPRHVPDKVLEVPDIPRTISGKIVELAVRNVIHGEAVTNTDALANPDTLRSFENRPELAR